MIHVKNIIISLMKVVDFKKSCFVFVLLLSPHSIQLFNLSRGELGYSLGSFRNGVLGEFTRKHKANSSLDLS